MASRDNNVIIATENKPELDFVMVSSSPLIRGTPPRWAALEYIRGVPMEEDSAGDTVPVVCAAPAWAQREYRDEAQKAAAE